MSGLPLLWWWTNPVDLFDQGCWLVIYRNFKSIHFENSAFTLLLWGNVDLNKCEPHIIFWVG